MISYSVYKIVHLTGVFAVFLALGAMTIHVLNGGNKNHPTRKLCALTHGLGLVLVLVGGFGLLARLGMANGLPGWIYLKLGVWLFLGGLSAVIYRKPELAKMIWFTLILSGGIAVYLVQYKPL